MVDAGSLPVTRVTRAARDASLAAQSHAAGAPQELHSMPDFAKHPARTLARVRDGLSWLAGPHLPRAAGFIAITVAAAWVVLLFV